MPVFACLFHIKELLSHSVSYTSGGKHSLYCADFSLSPHFILPPSSLSPGRAHSYTHPGTSLEVYRPHTEQREDLSLTLFLLPFLSHFHFFFCQICWLVLYHSLFFIVFSFSTSRLPSAWPWQTRRVVCPLLHVSISTLASCPHSLFVWMCWCELKRGRSLSMIFMPLRPPSWPGQDMESLSFIFQRLHCSQGLRAEWD